MWFSVLLLSSRARNGYLARHGFVGRSSSWRWSTTSSKPALNDWHRARILLLSRPMDSTGLDLPSGFAAERTRTHVSGRVDSLRNRCRVFLTGRESAGGKVQPQFQHNFRRHGRAFSMLAIAIILIGVAGVSNRSPAEANTPIRQHNPSKGKGFDACQAPTVSKMRDFWDGTPYWYVGVYTGGRARSCSQPNLSESWFSRVDDIGYGFLLIHVGPQAPCTNFNIRMSSDPATAREQGRTAAGYAINQTIEFGFHVPGDTSKRGPVIYYNVEPYDTSNDSCSEAVRSFIAGWTAELHLWRRVAGVYGQSTGMSWGRLWNSTNKPNNIWIAEWDHKPNVYNVDRPSDEKWQYRRFKQFKGEIFETHNGTTLEIDKNCARGQLSGDNSFYGDNSQCY